MSSKITNFLNENGQLVSFPAKRKMKLQALVYLSSNFEQDKIYTEKEFNEILNKWHTFGDPATLRRELYDFMFVNREPNGKSYWLEKEQPQIEE